MHPGYIDFFERLASVSIWLTFGVIRCHLPPRSGYTNVFDDDYIQIFNGNYDLKCWMTFKRITPLFISWDPTQARRSRLCETYCRRLFLLLSSTTSYDSPSSSTSLSFEGTEAAHPGNAQTTAPITKHCDTTTSPTSTCTELESSAWHVVTTLGRFAS